MKKTFNFESDKIKSDRKVEAIRYEIKKYIARERRKELPEEFNAWVFDCKFGPTEESAEVIQESDIKSSITKVVADGYKSFYIEILSRAVKKASKEEPAESE